MTITNPNLKSIYDCLMSVSLWVLVPSIPSNSHWGSVKLKRMGVMG
jgi:hypothetical protein